MAKLPSNGITEKDHAIRGGEFPSFLSSKATIVATVIRILLIFQVLPPDLLRISNSPAFQSTIIHPTYLLEHVEEALAIRNLFGGTIFANSYVGNKIQLPPILLEGLETFVLISNDRYIRHVVLGLFLLIIDFSIANLLEKIGRCRLEKDTKWEDDLQNQLPESIQPKWTSAFPVDKNSDSIIKQYQIPSLLALFYYASPVVILSGSLYTCFQNLTFFFLLLPLGTACGDSKEYLPILSSRLICGVFLALATYIDVSSIVYLVPMSAILKERHESKALFLASYFGFLGFLVYRGSLMTQPNNYFEVLWSTSFSLYDAIGTPPNLSMAWYFAIMLFDRFKEFYRIMQLLLPYLALFPLSVRLRRYPMALVAILWMVWTVFSATMTLYKINVGLGLMLLSPRSLARLRPPLTVFVSIAIVVPLLHYIVNYDYWLTIGNGDPNFVFFQCLGFNVFLVLLILEFAGATLQRDKALRLVEKLNKRK